MFFKLLDESSKEYTFGPFVHSQEYMLTEEEKDTYTYPVDGWYWFDTEEEAKLFFNITNQ